MPFINVKVSTKVSEKQEKELKQKLGKAIEAIPGKSEQWLMLNFEPESRLYFKGRNDAPIAYADVKIFGGENPKAFSKMTGELCGIFQEVLGVAPDHTYIAYHPIANWGWNGGNF